MTPALGYWHLTGLVRPIRLLLKYKGVEFEDKTYNLDKKDWLEDKSRLVEVGFVYPNLPYWIDGDVKLTESLAILYHLGRKYQMGEFGSETEMRGYKTCLILLLGKTEEEKCLNDMAYSYNHEVRTIMFMAAYNPGFAERKPGLLEEVDGKLAKYEAMLGDSTWFTGNELAVADFQIYDMVDILRHFKEGCLKRHSKLLDFMDRFEAIPSIKTYMESDSYIKYPFYMPQAAWGN